MLTENLHFSCINMFFLKLNDRFKFPVSTKKTKAYRPTIVQNIFYQILFNLIGFKPSTCHQRLIQSTSYKMVQRSIYSSRCVSPLALGRIKPSLDRRKTFPFTAKSHFALGLSNLSQSRMNSRGAFIQEFSYKAITFKVA